MIEKESIILFHNRLHLAENNKVGEIVVVVPSGFQLSLSHLPRGVWWHYPLSGQSGS